MRNIKKLLEMITDELPPPVNELNVHNIKLIEGELTVEVVIGEAYRWFTLKDDDLDKPIDQLFKELMILINKVD